jgi:type I restriction enzyme S subunit
MEEQKRIVAAIEEHFFRLDAVDSAVDAAQEKLVALRRSSFDQLFDKPSWTWTTLGEIAEVKGGVTKDSKNQGNPAYIEVPYLRVANVQRGYLNLDEVTTIRVNPEKAARLRLRSGDILFNEGGDRDKLGRGWVWEGQIEGCIHQNHVFRARLTSEAFDPYFVSMHGNSWGQRWFETHGKQTTNLASLNLTTLKSFPVPAPSLDEQREVVTRLQEIMDLESRLREELDQARRHSESLRRSILSDVFTGRLVPQDPNDEPASALLERIAVSRQSA